MASNARNTPASMRPARSRASNHSPEPTSAMPTAAVDEQSECTSTADFSASATVASSDAYERSGSTPPGRNHSSTHEE